VSLSFSNPPPHELISDSSRLYVSVCLSSLCPPRQPVTEFPLLLVFLFPPVILKVLVFGPRSLVLMSAGRFLASVATALISLFSPPSVRVPPSCVTTYFPSTVLLTPPHLVRLLPWTTNNSPVSTFNNPQHLPPSVMTTFSVVIPHFRRRHIPPSSSGHPPDLFRPLSASPPSCRHGSSQPAKGFT